MKYTKIFSGNISTLYNFHQKTKNNHWEGAELNKKLLIAITIIVVMGIVRAGLFAVGK
jgi:hypothetical protein